MATEGIDNGVQPSLHTRIDRLVPPPTLNPAIPRDVMLDIESLSLQPSALVLSIGACTFTCSENSGPIIGDRLLLVPEMAEQIIACRHIEPSTQLWWAQPELDTARVHWSRPAEVQTVRDALGMLAAFVHDAPRVWANGICFDITVLEDLYRTNGVKVPWKYNVIRDARTFYDNNRPWRQLPGGDTTSVLAHHPVDDCVAQINRLWEAGFDR